MEKFSTVNVNIDFSSNFLVFPKFTQKHKLNCFKKKCFKIILSLTHTQLFEFQLET